jgi:hypothetical protein
MWEWAMRYVSAEQSIAAAGAAFAWVEDDSMAISEARRLERQGATGWFSRSFWRALLVTGLIIA